MNCGFLCCLRVEKLYAGLSQVARIVVVDRNTCISVFLQIIPSTKPHIFLKKKIYSIIEVKSNEVKFGNELIEV